jgi:hypothetical protein
MTSSPACWHAYGLVLEREYSDASLLPTHRLGVDAFAVQHPGDGSRQAIQSVGLHLARLMVLLEQSLPPRQANDIMLELGPHKHTLPRLTPPAHFAITVADVAPRAGTPEHVPAVTGWAQSAWQSWSAQHDFIRQWVANVRQQ